MRSFFARFEPRSGTIDRLLPQPTASSCVALTRCSAISHCATASARCCESSMPSSRARRDTCASIRSASLPLPSSERRHFAEDLGAARLQFALLAHEADRFEQLDRATLRIVAKEARAAVGAAR